MPQPNKIPLAFAASGDKNAIPESTETTGLASWRDGFPAITSASFSEGGIAPKRADFNGIFNALSLATLWQQQGGFYAYDATTDYEVGNVVEYNNDLYKCRTANGPSSSVKAPTDTTIWSKVMTAADAAALYLPLSGGTITGSIQKSAGNFPALRSTAKDSRITIDGGISYDTGAIIWLFGCDYNGPNSSGNFIIDAHNGLTYSRLQGTPDGSLTWQENAVVTVSGAAFTGQVTLPTPETTDNSTKAATTGFVNDFYKKYIDLVTVRHFQLVSFEGSNTLSFKMHGNIALVLARRGSNSILMLFDAWDSTPTILAYTGSNNFITAINQSGEITITNNNGSAVVIMAFTGWNDAWAHWPTD